VLLTGPKPITELPAYLRHFDCTIIPFLKNNLTGGIYPLKINEYLAAGKSVVTTDFSEDIRSFAQHVHIAENHDQFIKMIDLAVKDNSELQKQNRLEIARSNSWEERMNLFWDLAWNAYQNKKKI
jgi:glycosyltransferase involved in cell wall biosynthesis